MVNPPEADVILRRMPPLSYLAYEDSRLTQHCARLSVEPDSGEERAPHKGERDAPRTTLFPVGDPQSVGIGCRGNCHLQRLAAVQYAEHGKFPEGCQGRRRVPLRRLGGNLPMPLGMAVGVE